jgi:oligoendopeptidase F
MAASELAQVVADLGRLRNDIDRILGQTALARLVGEDPGDSSVEDAALTAAQHTSWFEPEWLSVGDEHGEALLTDPVMAGDRHHLRWLRSLRGHCRSFAEEEALDLRAPAAEEAWLQLFDLVFGRVLVDLGGRAGSVDEALAAAQGAGREERGRLLAAVHAAFRPVVPVLAHCLDTLIGDRLAMDELRGYAGPRHETDLLNQLPTAVVDGVLETIADARGMATAWYVDRSGAVPAGELQVDDVEFPSAPPIHVSYADAVRLLVVGFRRFDPALGDLVWDLVRNGHVDARPRLGKSTSSSCTVAGNAGPYVLTHYTGTLSDALTLAHEIGHAVHYHCAAETQSPMSSQPPLPAAELAANVGELCLLEELLAHAPDSATRSAIAEAGVDNSCRSTFRQVAITRYETSAYEARAGGERLTEAALSALWTESERWHYGPDVAIPPAAQQGWVLVPHPVRTRFYNYSYAIARLAALRFMASCRAEPPVARRRFVEFLGWGGAASPADQFGDLGVPLTSETWRVGLDELEAAMSAARSGRPAAR